MLPLHFFNSHDKKRSLKIMAPFALLSIDSHISMIIFHPVRPDKRQNQYHLSPLAS